MFEKLPWDSNFFGFTVARLNYKVSDNRDILREFDYSDVTCLYLFIDKEARAQQEECKRRGYKPIEIRLRFAKQPQSQGNLKENNGINITSGIDKSTTSKLYSIAHEISEVSRFYKDTRFRPMAYKLYERWIQMSADKKEHIVSLIAWEGTIPVSLLTLKNKDKTVVIDLFGVKETHRRRGIGTLLLRKAEELAYQRGAQSLEVVTQKDNSSSCSLYRKYGFTQVKETAIYHLWKNN